MTLAQLVTVEVMSDSTPTQGEFNYQLISDPSSREWAESAAGFITFGLGQAVVKVLEAGNLLAEAKQRLPHGEYLPWVQQACGLKPQHASRLIKAAEWANVAHAQLLDGVTDATTLFILSADTTTEEVREWFMERCAAGDPPTRKEVQERKRSAGQPRAPQPTEAMALSIIRKGAEELERMRQAIALAERAQLVTAADVMAEQRLRDLGKQRFIPGADADFHRMKDGGWIRLPHAGMVDVVADPISLAEPVQQITSTTDRTSELLSVEMAAARLGIALHTLRQALTPGAAAKRGGKPLIRNGLIITRANRGYVRLFHTPEHQ